MPAYSYDKIKGIYEEKKCILLTTEEEFISNKMNAKFSKFNIISSCGHKRENCRFKDFKYYGVGILCYECANIDKIKKLDNNNTLKIERTSIELFKKFVENIFTVEVMNEATKADIGIRLKNNTENLWFPIQLKCTSKPVKTIFKFRMLNKNYDNMIIVCISLKPVKIWVFDGNDENIKNIDILSIGINSKNNNNEVDLNKLDELLVNKISLYPNYYQTLENLNTSLNATYVREKEFIDLRKLYFPNINFIKGLNNTVIDFSINSYNIQEKVGHFDNNSKTSVRFNITKMFEGIRQQPYNINDNDYYWLNFPNKDIFILIPSNILYDHGYLSKNRGYGEGSSPDDLDNEKRKTSLQFCMNNIPEWIADYIYEYKPETEKKLLDLFNNLPKKESEKEIIDITTLLENNDINNQNYLDSKCKAKEILCIDCNSKLNKYNSVRCVECRGKNQIILSREAGRPSYLQLKEELKTNTYQDLGNKYNVSKVCVFNWVKKYEKHNLTDV